MTDFFMNKHNKLLTKALSKQKLEKPQLQFNQRKSCCRKSFNSREIYGSQEQSNILQFYLCIHLENT